VTDVKHRNGFDELSVSDSWVNLGQLRELVAEADRRGWSDRSLVSARTGTHIYRHDINVVKSLYVEGRKTS
jgi:hypothetical protein